MFLILKKNKETNQTKIQKYKNANQSLVNMIASNQIVIKNQEIMTKKLQSQINKLSENEKLHE